ncbi:MAG TPA: ArsI/CadI family heavy metal resistance metalloenzyme [Pyrinomonadaceae bacterium]|jgi:catechol 2,3-dioxygenase-like lactoylglutathione lyase family enzyme
MEKETTATVQALKAHLALNVKNVEQSTEFYRRMLGIEPSKVCRGYAKFDVQNPPLNLTLNEAPFKERGALSHLGIQLTSTEDVLAMRKAWAGRGLVTREEMQTNCCYAVQDKTWVTDPDGNQWEAFVVLEDNLAETTTCCVSGEPETAEAASSKTEADSCCATSPTEAVAVSAPVSITKTCCG